MNGFLIRGGKKLYGETTLQGSKNAVLPILCACVLVSGPVCLENVPDIGDVHELIKILREIGVVVEKKDHTYRIDASAVRSGNVESERLSSFRGGFLLLGALAGKTGSSTLRYPGGCKIGTRPVNYHLSVLRKLGAIVTEKEDFVTCIKSGEGGTAFLPYPSVGATENALLYAVLSGYKSEIQGAAKEPEIIELVNFLRACGAEIAGEGTDAVMINGKKELTGCTFRIGGDRIVLGTLLLSVAACGGEIMIKKAKAALPSTQLTNLLKSCCILATKDDNIYIKSIKRLSGNVSVQTAPYPAFPTDLQAQLFVLFCLANGECSVRETVFENRFGYVRELKKMGADVRVEEKTAFVRGVDRLIGASVRATDLRGGAALVMAGLAAEGESVVSDAYHIDRGYERIEKTYEEIGADIVRE